MYSLDFRTTSSQLCEYDPESEKSILKIRGSGTNYLELTELPAVFNESRVEEAVRAGAGLRRFPDCPDFGAVNKVRPFMIVPNSLNSMVYHYSRAALQKAGTLQMCIHIFDLVLQAWGFGVSSSTSLSQTDASAYVRETITHFQHVELSSSDIFMGVPCVTVKVQSENKKHVVGYKKTPAAPDFGAYFKIPPIYTHDYPYLNQYRYSLESLSRKGVEVSFFHTYWLLLEKFGFTYSGHETNRVTTFYFFHNYPAGMSVSCAVYDTYVTINVSHFCIEC